LTGSGHGVCRTCDWRCRDQPDGEDPDAPLPAYQALPDVQSIRTRLGMSQAAFASTIGVPVATVRNWEQRRTGIAPAARTLLRILEREPEAAMRALAG
jgi:putative transcriptional regulator